MFFFASQRRLPNVLRSPPRVCYLNTHVLTPAERLWLAARFGGAVTCFHTYVAEVTLVRGDMERAAGLPELLSPLSAPCVAA